MSLRIVICLVFINMLAVELRVGRICAADYYGIGQ